MRSSTKDRALVTFKYFEPGTDIGGVIITIFERQPKIGTDKGSPYLGDLS